MSKKIYLMVIVCISLHHFNAMAGGSGGSEAGGGGDAYCGEYSDLMGRITSTLINLGQTEVSKTNNIIEVDNLWNIKRKLKCIPVDKLDRQARSYPSDIVTKLLVSDTKDLVSEWKTLMFAEKIRLVCHELAVLAEYENDGEYFISESICELALKNNDYLRNFSRAKKVIKNSDGSTTFLYPFFFDENNQKVRFGVQFFCDPHTSFNFSCGRRSSSAKSELQNQMNGICKFYGFKKSINPKDSGTSIESKPNSIYTSISNNGHIAGVWRKSQNKYIVRDNTHVNYSIVYATSVTCL